MKGLDQAARVLWISLVFCLRNSGGWVAVRLSTRSRTSALVLVYLTFDTYVYRLLLYLGIHLGVVS